MLTWAYAFMAVKTGANNGIHLCVAMISDVAIFYYISEIFK